MLTSSTKEEYSWDFLVFSLIRLFRLALTESLFTPGGDVVALAAIDLLVLDPDVFEDEFGAYYPQLVKK